MTQDSAPEAVTPTGIVDVPLQYGGRELPLDEFTSPENAHLAHNQAYSLLSTDFLDRSIEDPDRPAQDKDHRETAAAYEERLLKGVEEALQPDAPDDISPAGLWARSKLLAMESGRPDSKDLVAAVHARRALRQQADWDKQEAAYIKKINDEHWVAEHVFSDSEAGGIESARGKLSDIVKHTPEGPEVTESVLLDTVAQSIAHEALSSIPDETITDLADLKGVKGVTEVRAVLRDVARDVAFSGSEISYRSVRAELTRRLTDRDTSGGAVTERGVPTGPLRLPLHSAERASLHRAQMMLDRQFDTTMMEALRRVRGLRGIDDLGDVPTAQHGETSTSVLRAVAELKKIPQNPDGLQAFLRDHGIEDRILGRLTPHRKGEDEAAYATRRQENGKRLMEKLALNFNDYALKGTDWMARLHSHSISSPKGPTTITDQAFEQRGSGTAQARRTVTTRRSATSAVTSSTTTGPTPTRMSVAGGAGSAAAGADHGGAKPDAATGDGKDEVKADDAAAAGAGGADGTGKKDGGPEDPTTGTGDGKKEAKGDTTDDTTEKGDGKEKEETPPGAPGSDNGKDGGPGDGTGDKPRELATTARLALVSLKHAGARNIDDIARFVQNRQYTGWQDKLVGRAYRVPFFGALIKSFAHPVRTFWQGMVIKGWVDGGHMQFAARMRNAAKEISKTDSSVPFEMTEELMQRALDGAKTMKAQEGFARRMWRNLGRNFLHTATGLVRSAEMVRAEEWLRANGQQLVAEQKEATLKEQTAKAEQFTLQGSDKDSISTELGERRLHIPGDAEGDYAAFNTAVNTHIKGFIEQYASGQIDQDALLVAVNAYIRDNVAPTLKDDNAGLLASREFATNILPIANEIKSRWAEYSAKPEGTTESAFDKFKLDLTLGTGVWGGARSADKEAPIRILSMRDALAHTLADGPVGMSDKALSAGYGLARNLWRYNAFSYAHLAGQYAGMLAAGWSSIPARTLARAGGILGIAGVAAVREGGVTWSQNGRLKGLGGRVHEKYAQTSYELARGRKSPADAVLMKEMEKLMVSRVPAEKLTTDITTLTAKEQLTPDEAQALLSAVAHARARIALTDQSVVRQGTGVRRVFDIAAPNNFIEFSEGAENRQYMALRHAIVDAQIALARGKHDTHLAQLDNATLVMQGQLARGSDKAGVEEWLVKTHGKTQAEAHTMVEAQFTDLKIEPNEGLNKRMTALAKYSWRQGAYAAGRAIIYGGVVSGAAHELQQASSAVTGNVNLGIGEEIQAYKMGPEIWWENWRNLVDGHVKPEEVIRMGEDAQGNAIALSTLSPYQEAALMATHAVGSAGRSALETFDKITPGETFHFAEHMSEPVAMHGLNISLPEDVHYFSAQAPIPGLPHDVIFDGRNGHVYDMTHEGMRFGTHDFDGDGKFDLSVHQGEHEVNPVDLTDKDSFFHGFKFDHRDPASGSTTPDYEVGAPCEATLMVDGHLVHTVIPTGTQWIEDAQGNHDLVLASDHNVVFMDDVAFNPDGTILAVGDNSLIDGTHVHTIDNSVTHHSEGTFNPDGTINENSVWGQTMRETDHFRYFSENGSQLGVHTIKEASGPEGSALIISMQEAAKRSGHIAEAVFGGKEHGFYFSHGGHHGEGIYVPAHEGLIKLDPNDHTPMSIAQPDGSVVTTSSADLYHAVVNDSSFQGLPDGDIATELYHHRDVFALKGPDGREGTFEAVIPTRDANGDYMHEIIATGKGSSPASEGFDYTTGTQMSSIDFGDLSAHTDRIFEVIPPFRVDDGTPGVDGSPVSAEFVWLPLPTHIEKERSIKGDNTGKAGVEVEGVSFGNGVYVDTTPKPADGKDGAEEGDGKGDGKGKDDEGKEDDHGAGADDDEGKGKGEGESGAENKNAEQIQALKDRFTGALDKQITDGKITAEDLAGLDLTKYGLEKLTVEQAQEIIADEAKRAEYLATLWDKVVENYWGTFSTSHDELLKDELIPEAIKALQAEDPATSGLSEAQRKLLDPALQLKMDEVAKKVGADPKLNFENKLKESLLTMITGQPLTDDEAKGYAQFYRDFISKASQMKRDNPAMTDTEITDKLLSDFTSTDIPQLISDRAHTGGAPLYEADNKLTNLGKTYMSALIVAAQSAEFTTNQLALREYSRELGVKHEEARELLAANLNRADLNRRVMDRAMGLLRERPEYIEGLTQRVEELEKVFGIEVVVTSDDAGGDDGSGTGGGGAGGGAGGTGTGADDTAGASGSTVGGKKGKAKGSAGGVPAGGPETAPTGGTAESGAILGSERAQRVLKALLKDAGRNSPEVAMRILGRAEQIMLEERAKGTGQLRDSITEMSRFRRSFVDGGVAFIPQGNGRLITVGDLHGDSATVEQILKQTGFIANMEDGKKDMRIVFMGDYMDRGPESIRVMEMLAFLKAQYPDNVILMKADHEVREGEVHPQEYPAQIRAQFGDRGEEVYQSYLRLFDSMPRMVVTGNGIVIGHGGPVAWENGDTPTLRGMNAPAAPGKKSLFKVMEWADPEDQVSDAFVVGNGARIYSGSDSEALRDGLIRFYPRALDAFLARIGGKVFVRGHEDGPGKRFSSPDSHFHGKLMQVHSTGTGSPTASPRYGGNLPTYGDFDLAAPIEKIDYDKNQRLVVWP